MTAAIMQFTASRSIVPTVPSMSGRHHAVVPTTTISLLCHCTDDVVMPSTWSSSCHHVDERHGAVMTSLYDTTRCSAKDNVVVCAVVVVMLTTSKCRQGPRHRADVMRTACRRLVNAVVLTTTWSSSYLVFNSVLLL